MPQTTGKQCATCGLKITTAIEGTWCVSCGQFFHVRCATSREDSCPACGKDWIDPKTLFFYAERCPVCGHPNTSREEHCEGCRRPLRWDTRADLIGDLPKLRSLGRERSFVGIVQIVGGALILADEVLEFLSKRKGVWFPVWQDQPSQAGQKGTTHHGEGTSEPASVQAV